MSKDIRTFEIKCLKCNTEYRVKSKYCGNNFLCENCGMLFVVPTLEELIEDQQAEEPAYEIVSDDTAKINRSGIRKIEGVNYKKILQTSSFMIPPRKD